jgi:hypothetical protein
MAPSECSDLMAQVGTRLRSEQQGEACSDQDAGAEDPGGGQEVVEHRATGLEPETCEHVIGVHVFEMHGEVVCTSCATPTRSCSSCTGGMAIALRKRDVMNHARTIALAWGAAPSGACATSKDLATEVPAVLPEHEAAFRVLEGAVLRLVHEVSDCKALTAALHMDAGKDRGSGSAMEAATQLAATLEAALDLLFAEANAR